MEWLKDARVSAGATQKEIADRAGITQPTYSNIENGERNPSVAVAKSIAAALGFPWTRFFEDSEVDELLREEPQDKEE